MCQPTGWMCVSMYEAMLTFMKSLVYWRIVNILISLGLWTYFCWQYALPFWLGVWNSLEWISETRHRMRVKKQKAVTLSGTVYVYEKESVKKVKYIGSLVTWPVPNTRLIFAQDKFIRGSTCWHSCRHQHVTSQSNQVLDTIYFIFAPIFVSGTSEFGSYFSRIFHMLFTNYLKI